MSPLRVAVIGGGNIAQQHLPVLTANPRCEVAVLCDTNPAVLAESADRFSIPERVSDPATLINRDDLDAVFVMVSVLRMFSVSATFLEAGMPTFLEKPPGIYSSETAKLAEIQQRKGTIAVVGLNRRFYSHHLAARQQLYAAGAPVTVTVDAHEDHTRHSREKFPPLVIRRWAYANGIHALDLLRFFGGDVAEVVAHRLQTAENPFPDCYSAFLRFTSGAHGRAAVDWIAPGSHRFEVRAIGTRITSEPGFRSTVLATRGQTDARLEYDADDQRFKPGFWKQDDAFLAGVSEGKQPPWPSPDLADAHHSMVMIDQICQLSATPDSE